MRTPKKGRTTKRNSSAILNSYGRSLSDFGALSSFEESLVANSRLGQTTCGNNNCTSAKSTPCFPTTNNRVRAKLLRFLILGGDDKAPVHEKGILLEAAWIEGNLELQECSTVFPIWIDYCHVEGDVNIRRAKLSTLSLKGSVIDSLEGDGVQVTGDLFLDSGFTSQSNVRILGAEIKGDLYLDGARIGANISRSNMDDGDVLSLEGTRIGGLLNFRSLLAVQGSVSVQRTTADALADDYDSWAKAQCIFLDGFKYSRIVEGPTSAAERIRWLKRQDLGEQSANFKPQPWEQLIVVLGDMGHDADARAVAIAKQEAQRAAGKFTGVARPLHWLYGLLAGYGYKPLNTICAMLLVFSFGCMIFDYAEQRGWMAPTSPIIHANEPIADACAVPQDSRLTTWTICPQLPNEYTTYNPILYSLDLVLPLVNLQQEQDWAPIVTVNGSEWALPRAVVRFYMWFEILFGWAASLLLVAVLGNLVKRD